MRKTAHADVQPDGCSGWQLDREVLRLHGDGLIGMCHFAKLVLGEGPGLYDQISCLAGVQVDQMNAGTLGVQAVDQSGHIGGQPGRTRSESK